MYANESQGGLFPRVLNQDYSRNAACDRRVGRVRGGVYAPSVYPEYLSDLNLWICPSAVDASEVRQEWECPTGGWCQTACVEDPNYGRLDIAKAGEAEEASYYYYGYLFDHDGAYAAANLTLRNYATAAAGGESTGLSGYAANTASPMRALAAAALSRDYNPGNFVAGGWPAIQAAIDARLAGSGVTLAQPVIAAGSGGPPSTTLLKLKEGMERFLITDINNPAASAKAQSDIAVSWDRVYFAPGDDRRNVRFNHMPGGANVLYMDGHVTFLRYPNQKFPITPVHALFGRT
jgi:prepilin-type processing-associated H-X9-DG protein